MSFNLNPEESAIIETAIARAATDPAYRERLLHDPEGAYTEETGLPAPSDFVVRFVEKPADVDLLVVLPDPIDVEGELSEADLEAVAGGLAAVDACWSTCNGTSCGTTIVANIAE